MWHPTLTRRRLLGFGAIMVASGTVGAVTLTKGKASKAVPTANAEAGGTREDPSLLSGRWNLPGAHREGSGLRIVDAGFAIVNQDGSGGQRNSPVNLYGTYLQTSGDFVVDAGVTDRRGSAMFQMYGQPPIIADEFRLDHSSICLTITDAAVTVDVLNDSAQKPAVSREFRFATGPEAHLRLTRRNDSITVGVDGHDLGTVSERSISKSRNVWFGADAMGDGWLLSELRASGAVRITDASTLHVSRRDPNGLQVLASYRRPGFLVGAAMALGPAVGDPDYARIAFGGNFGSLTPENAMKMQFTQPRPGMYDFTEADGLVSLAQRHGMAVHGHALVFGEANPPWFNALPTATSTDKQEIESIMTDRVTTMVSRYRGRVATWDVVNEPLADGGGLRQHKWHRAMGEAYIAGAFAAARAADPGALLFVNEYGLESGDPDRWDEFLQLVTRLRQQGAPIDGVGMQAHVYQNGDRIDAAVLRGRIRQLAALGLKVRISEMDVYDDDGDEVQARQFADVLSTCIGEKNCVSFTTWGVSDRYDWFIGDDGYQQGADLLWGSDMRPRPARTAIQDVLRRRDS